LYYVQQIFLGGRKKLLGDFAPLATGLLTIE